MRPARAVHDYFQGQTLEGYVKEHGPLPVEDLLLVAKQVAEGLQAAHGARILHRDVKPANLLVRKEATGWKVKIIDFGLAMPQKVVQTSRKGSTARGKETMIGSSIAGTLDYGAPEQMGKRKEPDGPYSDVYGWAKTCCYALFQTTQPLMKHWKSVPEPLAELLEKCLEEDPRQRPAGFAEVLKGLDTGVASSAVAPIVPEQGFDFERSEREVVATATLPATRKKPKKSLLPFVLGGVGLLGVALVGVFGFVLGGPKKEGPEVAGRGKEKVAAVAERGKEEGPAVADRGKEEPADQGSGTQVPSYKEGRKKEGTEPPHPVQSRPAAFSGSKRFRFTDEVEINKDWVLDKGNSSWRIEGDGLRLTNQGALLESRFDVSGDLDLEMSYDMLPRCEIWMTIWGQRFEFKADGSKAAYLRRTGNTVVFGSGSESRTTLKLKSSQEALSTPITIRLDGLNLYRPKMELLVKSIAVSNTTLPSEQKPSGDASRSNGPDREAWVQLFNGHDLRGWKGYPNGTGAWRVEDGLLCNNGAGKGRCDLFSERGDYRNFHCRIEAKIEEGGNSGLFFRRTFGPQLKEGYEARIEANWQGPGLEARTGSLYWLVHIKEMLISPNEWFTMDVIAQGEHLVIKVNGKTTVDTMERERRLTGGHFALQDHTGVVCFRKIEVKELEGNNKSSVVESRR
jgi:hypothetical protein